MKSTKKNVLMGAFLLLNSLRAMAIQVGIGDFADEMEGQKGEIFRLINIIMTIILFAGIIYIVATLIGKREQSKGVIVGWVIAIVIWGIGNSLFN